MYEVGVDTVGRSLSLGVAAEWQAEPTAPVVAGGTVTSIEVGDGQVVRPGDVLVVLDLAPLVVAEGSTPVFRRMTRGDKGPDVAQLQRFLVSLGFNDHDPDGNYGGATESAVKAWQRSLDRDATGVVEMGDLVFVPELPARVRLGADISVGSRLDGEIALFDLVVGAPQFFVPLSIEQRDLVPLTSTVVIHAEDKTWSAIIDQVIEDPANGTLQLNLAAPDGGSICSDECEALVPLRGRTIFSADIVVVPETTGPAVPMAAIHAAPSGELYVILEGGEERAVSVVASRNGIAIVDGVEAGERVVMDAGF